jgi:hypothetical protein
VKKEFPGYYKPTNEEYKKIWDTCDFVFDANVLLNLYRYTEGTRQALISILESVKDRIWIPHQAALEYHRNRIKVIKKQEDAYKNVKDILSSCFNKIKNDLEQVYKNGRHPLISCDDFLNKLTKYFEEYKSDIDKLEGKHPNLIFEDPIKNNLTGLFEGRVCDPLKTEEEQRIIKEGEGRYKKEIPPGYKDNHKESPERYGDLILWFQIINHAKKRNKPIIFITDDRKEDWWYRPYDKTIGPRPELINEIVFMANIQFYMYSADPFMKRAGQYLDHKVNDQAIKEVENIRKYDEKLTDVISQIAKEQEVLRNLALNPLSLQIAKEQEESMRIIRQSTSISQISKAREKLIGSIDQSNYILQIAKAREKLIGSIDLSNYISQIAKEQESLRSLGVKNKDKLSKKNNSSSIEKSDDE